MNAIPIEDLMQHADSLYRFALSRVKDHHLAEDLVQDCLSSAPASTTTGMWIHRAIN